MRIMSVALYLYAPISFFILYATALCQYTYQYDKAIFFYHPIYSDRNNVDK